MSEQIDSLSFFEEVVFYRLIVCADDYGVYSGNPVVLSRTLFPMKESVNRKMMQEALKNLEKAGLILRYHVEGRGDLAEAGIVGKAPAVAQQPSEVPRSGGRGRRNGGRADRAGGGNGQRGGSGGGTGSGQ